VHKRWKRCTDVVVSPYLMKGLSLPQLVVCATILYASHVCISAERPHSVAAEFAAKAGIREVRKAIETGEGASAVAEESFRAAMKAAPESEEGVTARIWLARIDLEKAQAKQRYEQGQVER
jgi:hypothetical protein